MKLNENIRKFRLFRKMTQDDLAKQLSKSKSVISHWEKGENSPDLDSCESLCRILEVTPNQLFGWEDNPDYEAFNRRMSAYQEKIQELMAQKRIIEKEIHDLEVSKFEEFPPDWQ